MRRHLSLLFGSLILGLTLLVFPNASWAYSEMMRGATIGKNLVAMDFRADETAPLKMQ